MHNDFVVSTARAGANKASSATAQLMTAAETAPTTVLLFRLVYLGQSNNSVLESNYNM
jgi:hypothetical protein